MPHPLNRRNFLLKSISVGCLSIPVLSQLVGCKSSVQEQVPKKIYSEPKYELLDIALEHEFGAVIQYSNHNGVIAALGDDPEGVLARTLGDILCQEADHAAVLTEILQKNGVEPTIAAWPPQKGATTAEMLTKDVAAEEGAVKLYQQILAQDFDDDTRRAIEILLADEQIHLQMFTDIFTELS